MAERKDKTSMEQLMKVLQAAQDQNLFKPEGDLMEGRSYIPRMPAAMKKALADAIMSRYSKEGRATAKEARADKVRSRGLKARAAGNRKSANRIEDRADRIEARAKNLRRGNNGLDRNQLDTKESIFTQDSAWSRSDDVIENYQYGGAIPKMNQADKYMLSKNLSSKGRIYGKNKDC